jgi:hypothetical protein
MPRSVTTKNPLSNKFIVTGAALLRFILHSPQGLQWVMAITDLLALLNKSTAPPGPKTRPPIEQLQTFPVISTSTAPMIATSTNPRLMTENDITLSKKQPPALIPQALPPASVQNSFFMPDMTPIAPPSVWTRL